MSIFNAFFRILLPRKDGNFKREWDDCLQQLILFGKNKDNRILKMNLFIRSDNDEDFNRKKQTVTMDLIRIYGEQCPVFGILPNAPEGSLGIAIEVMISSQPDLVIGYNKYQDWRYAVVGRNNCKTIIANGLGETGYGSDTGTSARKAFELMYNILLAENMSFDHIVRQWNYIGNILHKSSSDNKLFQRYQAFNEVRYEYYQRYRSVKGFPAATGIGMNYDGVLIDFIAVDDCRDMQILSIFNPHQINPYAYEQKVLVGDLISSQEKKHPPMFDRAKLLIYGGNSLLYVSGTASIVGQETIGRGDIREQLEVTIENIRALSSTENISRYNGFIDRLKYKWIRVYIKYPDDFELVKAVCRKSFGDIPAIYLQADICRDDLLVEIEAQLQS